MTRTLLALAVAAAALAGCMGYANESTPTGDQGVGSSGVEGTGSAGDSTSCPDVDTRPTVQTDAQLVTNEETRRSDCSMAG
ncbi:MAG TPA: hypothetical protein VFH78_03115 [Candidatus Thermoplasmatota archaeon]|nr:hypothetical protein [Candidatus Thermoplasmatota archaeon]